MKARIHKRTGTIVCIAGNPKNLHSKYGEKLGLPDGYEDVELTEDLRVGDLIDGTAVPENYPVHIDSPAEILEKRVQSYKIKAAIREANAENDTEAVTELNAQLERFTND